ncbi:HNH endonuclease family protein [Streptomyces sp. NPDC051561]|uniref:HNH endonuclease family protein n=1 Tax=Streptomyces sp. NPDC051561 TaxID=3365658 RepID=UPI0037AB8761
MIKKLAYALASTALAITPLLTAAPAQAAPPQVISLAEGISALPLAAEARDGYQRTSFKHWVDADHNTCDTREEVLVAESRTPAEIGTGCKVLSGSWFSYYDGVTVTAPGGLDIDHMVPLAEAWDSGASQWNAARRQAYANDLGAERSLVAVTAKTNRSKSDQDPAEWLPPLADARCTYLSDWVSTKLRWGLTVDRSEQDALLKLAEGCGYAEVEFEPAPEASAGQ